MICFQQGSPARHFGHLPFAATLKKKGQSALSAVCGRQIVTQARVAPLREVVATGRRKAGEAPFLVPYRQTTCNSLKNISLGGLAEKIHRVPLTGFSGGAATQGAHASLRTTLYANPLVVLGHPLSSRKLLTRSCRPSAAIFYSSKVGGNGEGAKLKASCVLRYM